MKIELSELEQLRITQARTLWGVQAQVGMVNEECAELIVALNQHNRGRITSEDVASEVADVILMCLQMRDILGHQVVDDALKSKTERFMKRVESALVKEFIDPTNMEPST